jgi:hypothetical protein
MFARDDDGRDPAWETYLEYSRCDAVVFAVLRWRYKIAVDALMSDVDLDGDKRKLIEHVGDHLGDAVIQLVPPRR